jgi:hypothetical protein
MATAAISTAYNNLVDFFGSDPRKHCDNPEKLIDELINYQSWLKQGTIRTFLSFSASRAADLEKVKAHLAKLKLPASEFAKLCTLRNTEGRSERLAKIVMDHIFSTPDAPTIQEYKPKYEEFKSRGYKAAGGRRRATRKAGKRKSKTYRRRR